MAQLVKNLPARQETRVRSLGQGDPLEKEIATHLSSLTWRIPWTEEPDMLQSMGSERVRHDLATNAHTHMKKESFNGFLLTFVGLLFLPLLFELKQCNIVSEKNF